MAWLIISVIVLVLVVLFLWDHRDWLDGRRSTRADDHKLLMKELHDIAKRERE
jgi:hypothetical protein